MPYIGYFQLINAVDKFVVYDDIEYTKKGWFNRNRILINGADKLFTIPLKKDSDYLNVSQRYLADNFIKEKNRILSQIKNSYLKAPYFKDVFPLVREMFLYEKTNLFDFIFNSIKKNCLILGIGTEIILSSSLNIDRILKSQSKVLEICSMLGADVYINAIGGGKLYNKEIFKKNGIDLKFIKINEIAYNQFNNEFIPNLSIIDVMMFNSVQKINKMLDDYVLE